MSEQQPVNVGAPSERRGRFKEILSNRFGWNRSKTSESQLGISTLTTGEINSENIVISPQLQQSNFDCGQTVLDMLGYDGHQLFPDKAVTSEQLRNIPGAIELTTPVGSEEELDYTTPKVWIILGKDKVAGAQHWVIRHKNKIYCPTLGEVDLEEYKKRYVGFVLQTFEIPIAGQRGHNNSYGKIDKAKAERDERILDEVKVRVDVEQSEGFAEYGSWEWAEKLANKTNIKDPNWWYNCAGARGYRNRSGLDTDSD